MNRRPSEISKGHHSIEKLSPYPAILWAVVDFDLDVLGGVLLLGGEGVPPLVETIDHKVTGFMRTAKVEVQLTTILVDNAEGGIGFVAPHIMVTRPVIPSSLPATRIWADFDRRFGIYTQAFALVGSTADVFGVNVFKDGVSFWNFFCGLALTTLRRR